MDDRPVALKKHWHDEAGRRQQEDQGAVIHQLLSWVRSSAQGWGRFSDHRTRDGTFSLTSHIMVAKEGS